MNCDGGTCYAACDCREAEWARRLAKAEAALREISTGEHGEYCGYRNAMLTQGGKTECYSDCPVSIARRYFAAKGDAE